MNGLGLRRTDPDPVPPAGNCYRNLHGYKSRHLFQDRRRPHADPPAVAPESPQSTATPGSAHGASALPCGRARAAAPRPAAPFPDRRCSLAPPRQAGLAQTSRALPPASHWPRATITAGPVSCNSALAIRPLNDLLSTGSQNAQPSRRTLQRHRRRRACARPGARRGSRPNSALVDANLDPVIRHSPHKLHIRPLRENPDACRLPPQPPATSGLPSRNLRPSPSR